MASESKKQVQLAPPELGPFVLRTLLADVPLSADGGEEEVKINCVDYLDGHLYVGTSASELLHFMRIDPDPADRNASPVFILASRLSPAYSEPATGSNGPRPGVQQILLLPQVGKACILCNWTVTFYSLPELSPVFGTTQVKNCHWIGGLDLNEAGGDPEPRAAVTVLLSFARRIQVVRIGEDARVIKKIDFAGSTLSVRRGSIACVADSRSYALLDVNQQLKIPLMSISSLDTSLPSGQIGQAQDIGPSSDGGLLRSASSAQARPYVDAQAHTRSTSLGNFIAGSKKRPDKKPGEVEEPVFQEVDAPAPPRSPQPAAEGAGQDQPQIDKPLPGAPNEQLQVPPAEGAASRPQSPQKAPAPKVPAPVLLKPHILSPSSEEFLLVTGTGPSDPGIGMFVNLDGDVTRPTVEFEKYPTVVVVDERASDPSTSSVDIASQEEGYVLASMLKEADGRQHAVLEVQRCDANAGDEYGTKYWLSDPSQGDIEASMPLGIQSLLESNSITFQEVIQRLCQRRFSPFASETPENSTRSIRSTDSRTAVSLERQSQEKELFDRDPESDDEPLVEGWENTRNGEEEDFARTLAGGSSRIAVWSGDHIWWAIRNPLLLQLEAGLESATAEKETSPRTAEERRQLFTVLNSIRGRDAKTELEFMTFSYIRQRAGAMLLASFLRSPNQGFTEPELKAIEEVLLESSLDPRVVLALIPALRNEIVVKRKGIWIFGGVKETIEAFMALEKPATSAPAVSSLEPSVLQFIKRFLTAWRRKKGFGSVADESEVFRTVDAALLLILLELDQPSTRASGSASNSIRAELYDLVDKGVDCFDRAVDMLETYHRLFVLSRLHQSRRMPGEVLATWRRILDGEQDDGDGFEGGEQRMRDYLSKISSQALVQEYGLFLAARNPKLGVQVFADEKARAPKFEPTQVVALLREEAPDAVKYYLEHLVFGKGHTTYVNELITYYLDIVISDLQSSAASRDVVMGTYEAYRALRPPKPTYRQFLTDNAPPDDEVWHSRLRLLQLLGGANDYNAEAIRKRIDEALLPSSPTTTTTSIDGQQQQQQLLLVPEAIILDGRERHHESALRLLVHRLGDYDTAVSYCLRGGSSIYTPRRDSMPTEALQRQLFGTLLREFLALADVSDRVEQTGGLLERFGAMFDVQDVLALLPDGWSVDIAAAFLVSALSRLVRESQESRIARALSAAENLRVQAEWVGRIDKAGGTVEPSAAPAAAAAGGGDGGGGGGQ